MEKEFVPYELAVKLKALGFDEPCFGAYHNENYLDLKSEEYDYSYAVKSPTFSQAFRWFRENLHESGKWDYFDYRGESDFETYEEAELACLTKLIEIVETRTINQNKMTAVEFLESEMQKLVYIAKSNQVKFYELFEQAKAMEKEQKRYSEVEVIEAIRLARKTELKTEGYDPRPFTGNKYLEEEIINQLKSE
jgi:hypothetical protein